ncbi:MAG: NAD-dependent epimerase/dehydratase family protein [ANME-2 cluster archaeon]|nr:NAD-dependent epimerase/dehydratase family protein [ANME-2 cluster archaeon]MBC2700595.1 NAD-dependent epimerase/dehydratase family protein [ANME-2 cluster archaeon]MBC2708722.1 NAD-dependent epimerase/dehydratase family protein [ANME-2 cluster archaeon]MBC2747964.1 NAD-dependent epimerase/dehydratase family protein [ANME-2 cluster archaeon]MBC2763480.1 NAD-dependent epimerase/dehydratase family protein [ANME-2 cluster archaeon]
MEAKQILVTGCAGFIWKNIVNGLQGRVHEVIALDYFNTGRDDYTKANVKNFRQLEKAFDGRRFDYVYHLGAEYGMGNGEDHYENLWETNAIGTKYMLRLKDVKDDDKRYKEPQILSPPEDLSACYARGRAGNVDERRYIKLPSAFSCVHPRLISITHNSRDFLLFPGTIYSHRVHRENNITLCVPVFSVVDLLYHDPFILLDQNKLKSLLFQGVGT